MSEPKNLLIGRQAERAALQKTLESDEAELVAIYGRRRVGKTFLVREFFRDEICFELTGVHDVPLKEQLENFATVFGQAAGMSVRPAAPASWRVAFDQLTEFLKTLKPKRKHVVFLDELPWLASRRSRFLSALDHFWNTWGSRQRNLIVVICGSAASWMIRKVVQHRGGLHNRVTRLIRLDPFTLREALELLGSRKVRLGHRDVLQLYMVMGGVPLYLKYVEPGMSAAQNIDAICFSQTGLLRDEFVRLYDSLFEHSDRHISVIRVLAKKRQGLTRNEILRLADLETGGGTTTILEELMESGFVMRTTPYGNTRKDACYRIADEYSLFYLNWIERHRSSGQDVWLKKQASPAWRAWSGYAFENICLKHVRPLKQALGIAAVDTVESSWQHPAPDPSRTGAQVDLLIDRKDDCINLCEMKFSEGEFVIDKRYAEQLRNKRELFREVTKTRKTLFLTMVTTHGVRNNTYRQELVDCSIEMDALFE